METIVGVAVQFDGLTISMTKPNRHHHVLHRVHRMALPEVALAATQGFITSTGRFVTRAEARKIAKEAKQIKDDALLHPNHLFSEDLW